jgi:hypothetical protein
MWQQPQQSEIPTRQPFGSFVERRRQIVRRRIATLAFLVILVGGVYLARPYFPGVEASIRQRIASVFKGSSH